MPPRPAIPDRRTCERARTSRDPRFDGLFFTAVTSTRIYCRPVCPAPSPRPHNVLYMPSAAAAEAAGFRPCLRCRPELSPADGGWRRGDAVVARALKLIDAGLLADAPVSALAARVHVGERQLRRLFAERVGAGPNGVHGTRRLLFAKQLLTETRLAVTEVSAAAGFCSLRRFNASFQAAYRMAPRDLRRSVPAGGHDGEALVLRLGYRPPYDFAAMLAFLAARALPGVETVDAEGYARAFAHDGGSGWLQVSRWPGCDDRAHALRLAVHGAPAGALLGLVARVRRMFDLDADPAAITAVLQGDRRLAPLLQASPGLRIAGGWDGFEIAVRAVIGQQVSVAAARTVAGRLSRRFGVARVGPPASQGPVWLFPTPDVLAQADLAGLGLTGRRAATVQSVARALLDGSVDFGVERTLDAFVDRWTALPGIGPWTAHYIALRALGHPDACPVEDLVLQRALPADGSRLRAAELRARAEDWRPWRAYAVMHLWHAAAATHATRGLHAAPGPAPSPALSARPPGAPP